jgi:site-specific DNA recombinase
LRTGTGSRTAIRPRPEPGGLLADWAQRSGRAPEKPGIGGGLRFAFYGRVSTEDWQDPVTSLARQRAQAEALVRGHGQVVAEFFGRSLSRSAGPTRTTEHAQTGQAYASVPAGGSRASSPAG